MLDVTNHQWQHGNLSGSKLTWAESFQMSNIKGTDRGKQIVTQKRKATSNRWVHHGSQPGSAIEAEEEDTGFNVLRSAASTGVPLSVSPPPSNDQLATEPNR